MTWPPGSRVSVTCAGACDGQRRTTVRPSGRKEALSERAPAPEAAGTAASAAMSAQQSTRRRQDMPPPFHERPAESPPRASDDPDPAPTGPPAPPYTLCARLGSPRTRAGRRPGFRARRRWQDRPACSGRGGEGRQRLAAAEAVGERRAHLGRDGGVHGVEVGRPCGAVTVGGDQVAQPVAQEPPADLAVLLAVLAE